VLNILAKKVHKMEKKKILLVLLSLYSVSSFAIDDCSNAVSDAEINSCYTSAKNNVENELNVEYKKAKDRINKEYSTIKDENDKYNNLFVESQRGWLKYRNGQCELESFIAEKGTVTHDTLYNKCISNLDKIRIEQFKNIPYE